jgi:hypothetical protein
MVIRSKRYGLIIFFLLQTISVFAETSICDGNWVQSEGPKSHVFHGLNRTFEEYGSDYSTVRSEMCPTETLYHNCFYHGAGDRATTLLNRKWWSHDPRCENFHPSKFFAKMRNRNLYMIGDSTMAQNFKSLICRTLDVLSLSDMIIYPIGWLWYLGGTNEVGHAYNEKVCPFKAEHCLMHGDSIIHLRVFNVSIIFVDNSKQMAASLPSIMDKYQITDNDVMIANVGLHYNSADLYRKDISDLYAVLQTMPTPNFYFLETTPQHFTRVAG